jgi:hypothetical protein
MEIFGVSGLGLYCSILIHSSSEYASSQSTITGLIVVLFSIVLVEPREALLAWLLMLFQVLQPGHEGSVLFPLVVSDVLILHEGLTPSSFRCSSMILISVVQEFHYINPCF